jgi:hypothetical protein
MGLNRIDRINAIAPLKEVGNFPSAARTQDQREAILGKETLEYENLPGKESRPERLWRGVVSNSAIESHREGLELLVVHEWEKQRGDPVLRRLGHKVQCAKSRMGELQ